MKKNHIENPQFTSTPRLRRRPQSLIENVIDVSPIFLVKENNKRSQSLIPLLSCNPQSTTHARKQTKVGNRGVPKYFQELIKGKLATEHTNVVNAVPSTNSLKGWNPLQRKSMPAKDGIKKSSIKLSTIAEHEVLSDTKVIPVRTQSSLNILKNMDVGEIGQANVLNPAETKNQLSSKSENNFNLNRPLSLNSKACVNILKDSNATNTAQTDWSIPPETKKRLSLKIKNHHNFDNHVLAGQSSIKHQIENKCETEEDDSPLELCHSFKKRNETVSNNVNQNNATNKKYSIKIVSPKPSLSNFNKLDLLNTEQNPENCQENNKCEMDDDSQPLDLCHSLKKRNVIVLNNANQNNSMNKKYSMEITSIKSTHGLNENTEDCATVHCRIPVENKIHSSESFQTVNVQQCNTIVKKCEAVASIKPKQKKPKQIKGQHKDMASVSNVIELGHNNQSNKCETIDIPQRRVSKRKLKIGSGDNKVDTSTVKSNEENISTSPFSKKSKVKLSVQQYDGCSQERESTSKTGSNMTDKKSLLINVRKLNSKNEILKENNEKQAEMIATSDEKPRGKKKTRLCSGEKEINENKHTKIQIANDKNNGTNKTDDISTKKYNIRNISNPLSNMNKEQIGSIIKKQEIMGKRKHLNLNDQCREMLDISHQDVTQLKVDGYLKSCEVNDETHCNIKSKRLIAKQPHAPHGECETTSKEGSKLSDKTKLLKRKLNSKCESLQNKKEQIEEIDANSDESHRGTNKARLGTEDKQLDEKNCSKPQPTNDKTYNIINTNDFITTNLNITSSPNQFSQAKIDNVLKKEGIKKGRRKHFKLNDQCQKGLGDEDIQSKVVDRLKSSEINDETHIIANDVVTDNINSRVIQANGNANNNSNLVQNIRSTQTNLYQKQKHNSKSERDVCDNIESSFDSDKKRKVARRRNIVETMSSKRDKFTKCSTEDELKQDSCSKSQKNIKQSKMIISEEKGKIGCVVNISGYNEEFTTNEIENKVSNNKVLRNRRPKINEINNIVGRMKENISQTDCKNVQTENESSNIINNKQLLKNNIMKNSDCRTIEDGVNVEESSNSQESEVQANMHKLGTNCKNKPTDRHLNTRKRRETKAFMVNDKSSATTKKKTLPNEEVGTIEENSHKGSACNIGNGENVSLSHLTSDRVFYVNQCFGLKSVKTVMKDGVVANIFVHINDHVVTGKFIVQPGQSINNSSTDTAYFVENGTAKVRIGPITRKICSQDGNCSFFIPKCSNFSIVNEEEVLLIMYFTKFSRVMS